MDKVESLKRDVLIALCDLGLTGNMTLRADWDRTYWYIELDEPKEIDKPTDILIRADNGNFFIGAYQCVGDYDYKELTHEKNLNGEGFIKAQIDQFIRSLN